MCTVKSIFRAVVLALFLFLIIACAATLVPTPTSLPPSPAFTLPVSTAVPVPTSRFLDSTPSAALSLHGRFAFSPGDGSIWLRDAATGSLTVLVKQSITALAQLPAFSPDGKQIAYAIWVYAHGGTASDIRIMDADGKNDHILMPAENANIYYFYPRWSPDGKTLLVTRAENFQTLDEQARLELVDTNGAVVRTVVDNARDGDVSSDDKRIAFIRFGADDTYSLWIANADGSAAKELVAPGTFTLIMTPRISPDGQWLAFSATGDPQKPLPLAYGNSGPNSIAAAQSGESCLLSFLFTCFLQAASAHGAPGAVWRVNLESFRFEQITPIYGDSPTPTWSADGTEVATQDIFGLHLIDLQRQRIYPIDLQHGGTGGLDWNEAVER